MRRGPAPRVAVEHGRSPRCRQPGGSWPASPARRPAAHALSVPSMAARPWVVVTEQPASLTRAWQRGPPAVTDRRQVRHWEPLGRDPQLIYIDGWVVPAHPFLLPCNRGLTTLDNGRRPAVTPARLSLADHPVRFCARGASLAWMPRRSPTSVERLVLAKRLMVSRPGGGVRAEAWVRASNDAIVSAHALV
jgi:hypothetical protein